MKNKPKINLAFFKKTGALGGKKSWDNFPKGSPQYIARLEQLKERRQAYYAKRRTGLELSTEDPTLQQD